MPFTSSTSYGQIVAARLRAELVTKNGLVFNEDYQGNAATSAAVMIPRLQEATVGNYNKASIGSNAVAYDSNEYIPAIIDKDKFVNEYIDKRNMQTVTYDEVNQKLDSAGYKLAETLDTDGLQTLINAAQGKGNAGTAYASTDPRYQEHGVATTATSDFYADILTTKKAVKKNKANPEYLIVNEDGEEAIFGTGSKVIVGGDLSQKLIEDGVIAKVAGLYVLVTNNMPNTTDSTAKGVKAIISSKRYATRVMAWVEEPKVVDGNTDANIVGGLLVKGRLVFTHEVTQPKAVGIVTFTLSA
jgi:hypothetical protein